MTVNKTFVFKSIPTGVPVPGEHITVEDRQIDIHDVPPGGLIIEEHYASFDPYLRGRMRDSSVQSYVPAFEVGQAISNAVVGKVLESKNDNFKPGDLVHGQLQIAQYAQVSDPKQCDLKKINNHHGLDLALFLGALGMPGLTAWSGLYEIGKPKSGETIFISSAAGAVGQIVGQIAKKEGLKVVGSVGSDEKLDFITKELGFDSGFNYKKESPRDALARLAPEGIDIYFENVGGEHLEAALGAMKFGGRIPVCGMISDYNTPASEQKGIRGLMNLIIKNVIMEGFLVFMPRYGPAHSADHQRKMQGWLADGSVKAKSFITEGIDNAPKGFVGMLQGDNFGKAVLKIK